MLTINLTDGTELEAILSTPPDQNNSKVAICLHPWSWLGGSMNDPVLRMLSRPLLAKGYHVLRYNSRGVGKSTRRSSFTGFTEVQDLNSVIQQWVLPSYPSLRHLIIIGYSHGSLIASMQPILAAPVKTSHILLSYPYSPRGYLTMFRSATYESKLVELIRNPDSNVLIIYGDADEFTSASHYKIWTEGLRNALVAEERDGVKVDIIEIRRGTHFWQGGAGDELTGMIWRWLP